MITYKDLKFFSTPWSRKIALAVGYRHNVQYGRLDMQGTDMYIGDIQQVRAAERANDTLREQVFANAKKEGKLKNSKLFERSYLYGFADYYYERSAQFMSTAAPGYEFAVRKWGDKFNIDVGNRKDDLDDESYANGFAEAVRILCKI